MLSISISIDVPDLDLAQSFYCNALACTFQRDDDHGIRVLNTGSIDIYLLERAEGSHPYKGSEITRTYNRHWCPIHLDFGTTDLKSSADLIEKNGGKVEGMDSGAWGSIAYCSDPFGNGFCIIEE